MQEYKSRTYCRDIRCGTQLRLDTPFITEKTKERFKEDCLDCEAYKFHDWLTKNGYRIIKD